MKTIGKVLLVILAIALLLILGLMLLLVWLSKQPAVKEDYHTKVTSEEPLEQQYIQMGSYETAFAEYAADNEQSKAFRIWYPAELMQSNRVYPVVVMVNGTGVPSSKYEAVFRHLASWGFIVIGNEDANAWDGASSAASLDFMLTLHTDAASPFYRRVDTQHIGIAGHSQGGVGAINAVTEQENGNRYTAMYAASTTHLALAEALQWSYDASKITIPCFLTAGTKQADAGNAKDAGICPLWSLEENYQAISDDVPKLYARRINVDHGEMLAYADGYMTAWFLYHLQGDETAGQVFLGADAEILHNANWQDVQKNS